jgi:hypothetical protein
MGDMLLKTTINGYQVTRISGYQGIRIPGYQGIRIPGYQGVTKRQIQIVKLTM